MFCIWSFQYLGKVFSLPKSAVSHDGFFSCMICGGILRPDLIEHRFNLFQFLCFSGGFVFLCQEAGSVLGWNHFGSIWRFWFINGISGSVLQTYHVVRTGVWRAQTSRSREPAVKFVLVLWHPELFLLSLLLTDQVLATSFFLLPFLPFFKSFVSFPMSSKAQKCFENYLCCH